MQLFWESKIIAVLALLVRCGQYFPCVHTELTNHVENYLSSMVLLTICPCAER